MKLLIIEDDKFKLDAIRKLVAQQPAINHVAWAVSLHDALTALEVTEFDVVILDMAIPSHTSTSAMVDTYSQPVGGLDVMLFLASNQRPERIVVVTQYPTVEFNQQHVPLSKLVSVLVNDGISNVMDAVLFDESDTWKKRLRGSLGIVE